jgi:hypothetical protein
LAFQFGKLRVTVFFEVKTEGDLNSKYQSGWNVALLKGKDYKMKLCRSMVSPRTHQLFFYISAISNRYYVVLKQRTCYWFGNRWLTPTIWFYGHRLSKIEIGTTCGHCSLSVFKSFCINDEMFAKN